MLNSPDCFGKGVKSFIFWKGGKGGGIMVLPNHFQYSCVLVSRGNKYYSVWDGEGKGSCRVDVFLSISDV